MEFYMSPTNNRFYFRDHHNACRFLVKTIFLVKLFYMKMVVCYEV